MSASQLPCVLDCDNTDLATCTKSLWKSVLQFKHNQIYVSSQRTWHVITIMVPPSYFLYKCNGTDSDHVSSAAIFQPHNVSSAAFCQLRCSVLTQRIADCQLGCKVSAHWQIVSYLKLLESWHAVQCTGTLLLIQTTQSKRQQSNCPKTGTAQAPWIMGDLQLWCTIDELELHMQGLFVGRCVVMCDFSLSVLGRQSDCWWPFLLIASVCLLNSSSFIFHAACSFELHVLHIWSCKHILTRSQTRCLRVHVSMQTMFLLLIHQVENSKCMWYFDKLFWQQALNIKKFQNFQCCSIPKQLSKISATYFRE